MRPGTLEDRIKKLEDAEAGNGCFTYLVFLGLLMLWGVVLDIPGVTDHLREVWARLW